MGDPGSETQSSQRTVEPAAAGRRSVRQGLPRYLVEGLALGCGALLCANNWPWAPGAHDPVRLVVGVALVFQALLALAIECLLYLSKTRSAQEAALSSCPECFEQHRPGLPPHELLALEFGYAQTTASEAMNDRHTLVNFYLVLTGVVLSAVMALVAADRQWPLPFGLPVVGMGLLWLLDVVGWLYLLQLIRLRQAWRGSVLAMNQIKEFYLHNAAHFEAAALSKALRWQPNTVPAAAKLWTIHFFYAMLISLLNSVVYAGGGVLCGLALGVGGEQWPWLLLALSALSITFFAFSLYVYQLFLSERA